jgi:xyloglucan galactosyltransferase MUR3
VTPTTRARRTILSLFIGSVRTSNTNSNLLRRTLFAQCNRSPVCQWHTTAHACNGVVNASTQMLLFREAKFCPAPPGDSITRKSIFDALIAGCVPVIFAKASISQYLWYFTKEQVNIVDC